MMLSWRKVSCKTESVISAFFPCGQDDLEKKSHGLLRLADTCVCFPWPPVSGAFWAEWNRERLKCCFICCCICMDWWYISYSLSHHYGKLPDCGKGHGSGSLSMVWLVFILMNQEVKKAPATLCPQSRTPSDSFWPATPPTSEVPPLPKQCHKLGDISNPNLQTVVVKKCSEERVWWGGCRCSVWYSETERTYGI